MLKIVLKPISSCFVLNIDRLGGVLVVGVAGILKKKILVWEGHNQLKQRRTFPRIRDLPSSQLGWEEQKFLQKSTLYGNEKEKRNILKYVEELLFT